MFDRIQFDEPTHTYTCEGQPLTSVTKLIKSLCIPFDADYWANRKAEERGISAEEVKAEWDAKREQGLSRGTNTHLYIEDVLRGQEDKRGSLPLLPEMKAFREFWKAIGGARANTPKEIEWVVGCPVLGVAGTLDALIQTPDGLVLYDWKTGDKFLSNNRYQKLLHPFADIADCEFNRYSLQVSLYWLLINRYTDLPITTAQIVHLQSGGSYEVYTPRDFRPRLAAWLEAKPAIPEAIVLY
jgi:hypothetical protein